METHEEKTNDTANHHGGLGAGKMNLIDTCTNTLAAAIRQSSIYKDYRKALKELEAMPEIKARVDELRILNYKLQNDESGIDLYDAIDQIDNQFEELRRIPQVTAFLTAELALCKQLKNINATIHQGINIDIPNLED